MGINKSPKLVGATLILLLTVLLSSNTAKAQTCYLCPQTQFTTTFITMELPSWPGCPITVHYQYRICPGGITELRIFGFTWPDANDPDCAGLLAALELPNGDPNWTTVEQVYQESSETLPQVLFMNAYNNALPVDKPSYECPNGKKLYRGVTASCRRWVEIQRRGPDGQITEWVVRLESCNEEACCIEEKEICYNTTTSQLEVNVTMSELQGQSCTDIADPTDPDAIAWSDCMMWDCPEE